MSRGPGRSVQAPSDRSLATNIWTRILATPISSVGPSISNVTSDIEDFDIECSFDIRVDVLHLQVRISISKVFDIMIEGLIIRYEGHQPLILKVMNRVAACRHRGFMPLILNKHLLILYVDIVCDIEGHVITYRVQYRIRYSPGSITPAPKSLSATCPGFLHPRFAQVHSLIHRDLTRKCPSIASHPHVDFKKPAPSPTVGSKNLM